jgi:membrane protease YdiL (CAAX protease family)
MKQFMIQIIAFSIIGGAVWGLSRLLRCKPLDSGIVKPRKSSLEALAAVACSTLFIDLLMLRQRLLHGPTPGSGPRFDQLSDLIPQLVVLAVYFLPAGIFMFRAREPLGSAGITRVNLWAALLIGAALAVLTFYFQPGGLLAKLEGIEPRHGIALVFYAGVGFGEEFLFRGYLQNRLVAWLGKWQGWVSASVTMALVHLPHRFLIEGQSLGDSFIASCGLIPVSLLMGFIMLCVRNVVAPGIFHTFADWVNELN